MSGLDSSQILTEEASLHAEEIHHESHAKEHTAQAERERLEKAAAAEEPTEA